MVYHRIKRNLPKLMRFGIVGSAGAIVNFSFYYLSTEYFKLSINVGVVCAFSVAVTQNYLINHYWTFGSENYNNPPNIYQYFFYILSNLAGLLINLLALNIFILLTDIRLHLIGQGLGILLGMLSNFIFAKKFVFVSAGKLK